ncbi:MAG: 30S ribosomal protein S24e, partial [Promethearchaeota archaeon]
MSYKLETLEEKKNPLIDRLELTIKIEHFGKGTPNKLDLKKKVAASQGV